MLMLFYEKCIVIFIRYFWLVKTFLNDSLHCGKCCHSQGQIYSKHVILHDPGSPGPSESEWSGYMSTAEAVSFYGTWNLNVEQANSVSAGIFHGKGKNFKVPQRSFKSTKCTKKHL